MTSYCLRLDDHYGRFWLTERDREWVEDLAHAHRFATHHEASAMASQVRIRNKANMEWFPALTVVAFKGEA